MFSKTKEAQSGEFFINNDRSAKKRQDTEIDRLNRFGLDGSNSRFKHASIDQLHLHRDLVDEFKNDKDNDIDFKRMS